MKRILVNNDCDSGGGVLCVKYQDKIYISFGYSLTLENAKIK